MSVKAKYQPVLDLGEKLQVQNGNVEEVDGILKIKGTTKTQYEKNILWDKIKEIGGNQPTDIKADIRVEDTSVYHRHVVQKGETLGKIAKQYYGDASKYNTIFQANTDKLKNPDLIHPDQELVIPKLS
ncbi:LysM peptidoglycan-binding domain-containing protein [Sinomicrobium weinanense]|uniref:LysM peptidoglycan-binding domain-containing protein n=1 Tax=Sinomicrobium weinanense TaxID=2842200 RepID=A0A926Q2X7_9FLAO|nr:LysM peptidoglycan-binding domain-containing protein [Sinomicrobium weinanense]MBC9796988.1 LysM peptidoglycan-binding domain-containing protein [Sinomicrobium weinanense]MBU3122173.1 LysM peptidoglycan-binding domain-containing protein [Sinomicrobium weinanense]